MESAFRGVSRAYRPWTGEVEAVSTKLSSEVRMPFRPWILLFCLPHLSCAVSAPQHDIRGEEFFAEGGRILLAWTGEKPNDQFGWVASPLPDANGDGVADILTCAPFQSVDGVPHGRVYLYSGKDGSLIRQHDGARGDLLGLSVSSAGDLDGDGRGGERF